MDIDNRPEVKQEAFAGDDIAEKLKALLHEDDKESAEALLAGMPADSLKKVLTQLPGEIRVEALKCLSEEAARDVLKYGDADEADYFLRGLPSALVSEAVETAYSEGANNSVTDLPPFVIQKILTHGSPAARRIVTDSIIALIDAKRLSTLRGVLVELNPVDIADVFDDLDEHNLLKLFRLMPKDMAADVFIYLPQEKSERLIAQLSEKEAGQIIDDLYADDAADFLDEMPSKVVKKLLAQAKPETRAAINHLLQYKEGSAGSIMTVEFVDLKQDYTVEQAIARIRRDGVDKETIDNCFVLDVGRKLLGTVSLRKLLLARPKDVVGDLMEENLIVARTDTDREEVANMFKKYDFTSVPVCDSENRLVGIVTVDDIVDIIHEEALDDASYLSKVTPSSTEYLKTPVVKIWLNRMPWLLILMVSATFTGLIISRFEHVLLVLSSALFAYIPMLMDTGGNAGSQASVSIIRGMALGQIDFKDTHKILMKEILASLLLGLTMAAACFAKVMLLDRFIYGAEIFEVTVHGGVVLTGAAGAAAVGGIISFALFIAIIVAKIVGALLPIISKKAKLDPAVVSSPFITTIVDAIALLIYCGLALLMLG